MQILGADFILQDQKLFIEAKGAFIFLRNKQNELFEENGIVGLKERASQQANMDNSMLQIPIGAGDANIIRPLCDQILTQFSKLMEEYRLLED